MYTLNPHNSNGPGVAARALEVRGQGPEPPVKAAWTDFSGLGV